MFFKLDNIIDWEKPYNIRSAYIDGFMTELGFVLIGRGRMRAVYRAPNKRYVLKFPHHEAGLKGNIEEARRYSKYKNNPDPTNHGAVYAPCRLIQGSILIMWSIVSTFGDSSGCHQATKNKLLETADEDNQPDWVSHLDCNQAGYLRNGRIVAYDFTETY